MIGFNDYAKICNNYCICYFGYNNDYLIQLELLRPILELTFPGLNIYIGCKDESIQFLEKNSKNIVLTELKSRKCEFAHINELKYNGIDHPIQKFLDDSLIKNIEIPIIPQEPTNRCLILNESFHPTKNLTTEQIKKATLFAEKLGYYVEINKELKGAGLVIGVEHPYLFKAASQGIETFLIPTGIGTHLYKKMFPSNKIF